jgi:hypothetical protein
MVSWKEVRREKQMPKEAKLINHLEVTELKKLDITSQYPAEASRGIS